MIRHDRSLEKRPAWRRAARAWLVRDREKAAHGPTDARHGPIEVAFRYAHQESRETRQNPAKRGMTVIEVIETVCACGIVERVPPK